MEVQASDKPLVRVTIDEMEAYLLLYEKENEEPYTISELKQVLTESGVCAGIDDPKLIQMISENNYGQEQLVARGIKAVDGIDGYYEYHFDTNFDHKPKVLPNGSVDYWSVHTIESVIAGQVIVDYHPPVEERDGMTVKGKVLPAKKGRDQAPLKGKGFERSDDGLTYTAIMDGKIEMQNGRIVILPVYELSGDADLSMGSIDFRGDVVIHGGVESGMSIKSTGTVTIDGVVENCTIEAGGDIVLRQGMLGGGKSTVKTKGNITAKFFEFTNIECEGQIQADVLMDCKVVCQGKVVLNGPKGSIIGGEVLAIQGVEVSSLGNDAEKKTEIYVGTSPDVYSRLRILDKKIHTTEEEIAKTEEGLKRFEELGKERGINYAEDPRRLALLRQKVRDTAMVASDKDEARKLQRLVESSRGACVSVLREVYPGVVIRIDDLVFVLKNIGKGVEFYKLTDKVATRPCYRGVE